MSEESTEKVYPPTKQPNTLEEALDLARNSNSPDPDGLEQEQIRLREYQEELEKIRIASGDVFAKIKVPTFEEKVEMDSRSVFVGNVDYASTNSELEQHFHGCGSIKRVSIQLDKYTKKPKGFAYIEFDQKDSVEVSLALDKSLFKGRQIMVNPKRTNQPGISTTNRPPRGRFRRAGRGNMYGARGFRRAGFRGAGAFRPY